MYMFKTVCVLGILDPGTSLVPNESKRHRATDVQENDQSQVINAVTTQRETEKHFLGVQDGTVTVFK